MLSLEPLVTLRLKVAVIGDATVGKSAICQMFQSKGTQFPKNYKLTAGVELYTAPVLIPDSRTTCEMYLMDTGGQDIFRDQIGKYWDNVGMVALVYDCTSKASFDNCAKWLQLLRTQRAEKDRPITGVLIANKSDLSNHAVEAKKAEQWAENNGLKFFLVSALPGHNDKLAEPFMHLATKYRQTYESKLTAYTSQL
mmetsp:Transcript_61866/g.195485  ORF Transcript_61866/g.195485 Transcript_61866/m.195485 type:complete len:196 (+) Transcript_61866:252-839(+)